MDGQSAASRSLAGRVLKEGRPLAGVPVTLHRVTPGSSGPIATQTTGVSGGFVFRLPPPDTSDFTVFFATVEYQSVRYFGPPLHQGELRTGYDIQVHDTVSARAGMVGIARRDLILLPEAEGAWTVNEMVRFTNPGGRTLVSEEGMPVWEFSIPEGAVEFEAGEGDLGAGRISLMGSRVLVLGSLVPGAHELFLRYRLPGTVSPVAIALGEVVDTFNLYVRQPAPELTVSGLASTRSLELEGERFVHHSATGLAQGAEVRLAWTARGAPPVSPVLAAVLITAALLGLGSWAAFRNRSRRAPAASDSRRAAAHAQPDPTS